MRTAELQAGAWNHPLSKKGSGFLWMGKAATFLSFYRLL